MARWPVIAILLLIPGPVSARPNLKHVIIGQTNEPPDCPPPAAAGVVALSSHSALDTVFYGGTCWAPDSLRWEALRDSVWTFDTGVGSSINTGSNPNKPAGYHQTMEGWFGLDQTLPSSFYFRRSTTCAINGSYSMRAGVTLHEADSLCYAAGQGYGNAWSVVIEKTFTYPGSGNVTLKYRYAIEAESGFDYTYTLIDTTGVGLDPYDSIQLVTHTGVVSGTDSLVLVRGSSMRSTPGPVKIQFWVTSDGSYSDEDGLFPTACGHTAIDDIRLTGAIADFSDFESGANGWSRVTPLIGAGDFTNLSLLGSLPSPAVFCPCALDDTVLVFFDTMNSHPYVQDNVAVSPWINLRRGGDLGRPGRVMTYDVYAHLQINDQVFVTIQARQYPYVCPNGTVTRSPFRDQGIVFYYGESPFCSPAGIPIQRDYSNIIDSGAEQVQVTWGVVHLNAVVFKPTLLNDPGYSTLNASPYLDNIRFGVFGTPGAPIVTLGTADHLQDSFATDGMLNPASTGRVDPSRFKNVTSPVTGAVMADTLVARGNGGNTEVRLVFQIRPGPFADQASLLTRAARWTPEGFIVPRPDALGGTWYSARMDTAEQGGATSLGNWMSTYHENDPGFRLTDRTADPADPSELENEILPDHLLTPGSRVDYFIKSRYIPPDPRNIGGATWFVSPDTTGGRFFEAEILPASMGEDSTWNCTLYVDHHGDREFDHQAIEEGALAAALGPGGRTPEGTRYDRFDLWAPTQLSFGRPMMSNAGATLVQTLAYRTMVWHSASLSSSALVTADATILKSWLTFPGGEGHNFWGTGDGLATSMNQASTLDFMGNVLGVTRTCNTIRDAACPVGTPLDSTYCLGLSNVTGAVFATALPAGARSNGCPSIRSFDVLGLNAGAPQARGQLDYAKTSGPASFASVTNVIAPSNSKSVVDGFSLGSLRTPSGDPHNPPSCANELAAYERTIDVLGWFGSLTSCSPATTGVPEKGFGPRPPRPALGAAWPNPARGAATIPLVNGVEGGRVRLQIFSVTGRLVRTVVDGALPAGPHEIVWDGRTEEGRPAVDGIYFYRLAAGSFTAAKSLVLLR